METPSSTSATPWGSGPSASSDAVTASLSRRRFLDRLANLVVRGGGIAIIASILAILFVLFFEVYPLLIDPTRERVATQAISGATSPLLAVGVDEYREIAYAIDERGLHFVSLDTGRPIEVEGTDIGDVRVSATSALGRGLFAVGLADGRWVQGKVSFGTSFRGSERMIEPSVTLLDAATLDDAGRPIERIAFADTPRGPRVVAVVDHDEMILLSVTETTPMIGDPVREERRSPVALPDGEVPSALAIDERGANLFVGTEDGNLLRYSLTAGGEGTLAESLEVTEGVEVTSLGFLIGDRTIITGSAEGGVSSWQVLRERGQDRLTRMHDFEPHLAPVVAFSASARHKGFLTGDREGAVKFHFGTTGETLLSADLESGELAAVAFAPKADGFTLASKEGSIEEWFLDAPHPEITLKSLFGKVWYEGYRGPEHVWQSTGGTDDFEPKLSLTPLVYGTLKGTFYALVIAIPLALFGALYSSQFMHPTLKSYVKPTVEIMAALPSVVLGFIAGLWLAPAVEPIVPGIFLMPIVITSAILVAVWLFRLLPTGVRLKVRPGTEVFLLIPLVLAAGWLSIQLGYVFEHFMLAGDYRRWMFETLGLAYDQRNSLVVGLAMGFAVIPIIFTIAEDSLSNVPSHLRAGSLALGATPWQTAVHVILPTGSPGIFSAVMIGFGRAVGETMIVLMATGNTPVMDASIFSGLRALSANIAVELPEAPHGGTLYRVLFLAALLLFFTTFVVNTVAELVRLKLRNRYRVL